MTSPSSASKRRRVAWLIGVVVLVGAMNQGCATISTVTDVVDVVRHRGYTPEPFYLSVKVEGTDKAYYLPVKFNWRDENIEIRGTAKGHEVAGFNRVDLDFLMSLEFTITFDRESQKLTVKGLGDRWGPPVAHTKLKRVVRYGD